jgi:hypothetical protein
MPPFLVDLS